MREAVNKIKIEIGSFLNGCEFLGDEKSHVEKSGKKRRVSRFRCRCGGEFVCHFHSVKRGLTQSCGCYHSKIIKEVNKKHGLTGNKLAAYAIWSSMIQRCTNPNSTSYKAYGAMGVKACGRWLKYENFHEDMGDRPTIKHTLDRYPDKNGDYRLGNCRWATYKQQANNKNVNILVEYKGETKTLSEWCDLYHLKYKLAHKKYKTLGWGLDAIVNYPPLKMA